MTTRLKQSHRARPALLVSLILTTALAACRDDTPTHPFDERTATPDTADGRIEVQLELPADGGLGDLVTEAQRQAALRGIQVLLFGDDKDGNPVQLTGATSVRRGVLYADFAVEAGTYRFGIAHTDDAFRIPPLQPFDVGIGQTVVQTHRLERRPLRVTGRVVAPSEFPPDSVEVEIRWARDADDSGCDRGGVLGKPTVNIDRATFIFDSPMPFSPRLCAVARADGVRGTTAFRPLPPDEDEFLVDVGALAFFQEPLELRAFGSEIGRSPELLGGQETPGDIVDTRLILLEVRLDAGENAQGALAFPVDGRVPDGRTPVAELTVVDVSETGDQLGTPVRHTLETLGADEGRDAFLGAVSGQDCRDDYDAASARMLAALRVAAVSDEIGVGHERLLLPYCLTSRAADGREAVVESTKNIEVVLTAGGRIHRGRLALVLDQAPIAAPVIEVVNGHPFRGQVYLDGADDIWRVRVAAPGERRTWRSHVRLEPGRDPDTACPLAEDIPFDDFIEEQPDQTLVHQVPAPMTEEGLEDCYHTVPHRLCIYATDAAGNRTRRAIDVAQVFGRSGGFVRPGRLPPTDEPVDAPGDGGVDAGLDAGLDAEVDAIVDAEVDAAPMDPLIVSGPRCNMPELLPIEGREWAGKACPIDFGDDDRGEACEPLAPRRVGNEVVYRMTPWDGAAAFKAVRVDVGDTQGVRRQLVDRLVVAPLTGVDGPRFLRFIGIDLLDREVPFIAIGQDGEVVDGSDEGGVRFFRDITPPALDGARFHYCNLCDNVQGQRACDGCIDDIFAIDANTLLAPATREAPVSVGVQPAAADDDAAGLCARVQLDLDVDGAFELMRVEPSGIRIPPPPGVEDGDVRPFRMSVVDRACNLTDVAAQFRIRYDLEPPLIVRNRNDRPRVSVLCERYVETCPGADQSSVWSLAATNSNACVGPDPVLSGVDLLLTDSGTNAIRDGIRYALLATPDDEPPATNGPVCRQERSWGEPGRRGCEAEASCGCLENRVVSGAHLPPLWISDGDGGWQRGVPWDNGICSAGALLTAPLRIWLAVEDAVGNQEVYPLYDRTCDNDVCETRRYRLRVASEAGIGSVPYYKRSHQCDANGQLTADSAPTHPGSLCADPPSSPL